LNYNGKTTVSNTQLVALVVVMYCIVKNAKKYLADFPSKLNSSGYNIAVENILGTTIYSTYFNINIQLPSKKVSAILAI
jgi:hypothetical protein